MQSLVTAALQVPEPAGQFDTHPEESVVTNPEVHFKQKLLALHE